MERSEVKIGMQVMLWNDPSILATVISLPEDDLEKVEIRRDTGRYAGGLEIQLISWLEPYDKEKFESLARDIQESFQKATQSIEEAFRLVYEATEKARAAGSYLSAFADTKLVSFKEFEDVLEKNGWSTSTFWCNVNSV